MKTELKELTKEQIVEKMQMQYMLLMELQRGFGMDKLQWDNPQGKALRIEALMHGKWGKFDLIDCYDKNKTDSITLESLKEESAWIQEQLANQWEKIKGRMLAASTETEPNRDASPERRAKVQKMYDGLLAFPNNVKKTTVNPGPLPNPISISSRIKFENTKAEEIKGIFDKVATDNGYTQIKNEKENEKVTSISFQKGQGSVTFYDKEPPEMTYTPAHKESEEILIAFVKAALVSKPETEVVTNEKTAALLYKGLDENQRKMLVVEKDGKTSPYTPEEPQKTIGLKPTTK